MAGESGVRLVQGVGVLHGIEAHEAEGGVGHGAGMALAEHQPVTILPTGVLGVKFHDLTVQNGHQIRQIHRSAHMAEAAGVDDLQGFQPDFSRQYVALFYIHVTRILSDLFHFGLNKNPSWGVRTITADRLQGLEVIVC